MIILFLIETTEKTIPELADLAGRVATSVGLAVVAVTSIVKFVGIEVFDVIDALCDRKAKLKAAREADKAKEAIIHETHND